jgi:hypothetical protein
VTESEARSISIRVDFACNDEHGHDTGMAERVTIDDLELECRLIGGGIVLKQLAGTDTNGRHAVQIGKLRFWHNGYKYGVGNWCWDGYWLDASDALKLINYLMRQKYWHCESGPCDQFEKFADQQPFTLEDLQNCLEIANGK